MGRVPDKSSPERPCPHLRPPGQGLKPILARRHPDTLPAFPALPPQPAPVQPLQMSRLSSSSGPSRMLFPLPGATFLLSPAHTYSLLVSRERPPWQEQRSGGRKCRASRLRTENWCGWTQSPGVTGRGILSVGLDEKSPDCKGPSSRDFGLHSVAANYQSRF